MGAPGQLGIGALTVPHLEPPTVTAIGPAAAWYKVLVSKPLAPGRFFLPGPTEVHPDVLAAQARPMIGHRGPQIRELIEGTQEGLREVFQTERPVIVSTSSATGLMEAAVRNAVGRGRVLSLVNGAFSGRFAEIARMCGSEVEEWVVPDGRVHPPDEVADRIGAGYQAVTVTHSETSTGALQDIEGIAARVAPHPETLLLVDSVTGIGGVETRTDRWAIDFILTGSQKAMALPPGLAFGVASQAMMERSTEVPDRGWYFDLARLAGHLGRGQTPATPAISLLYALHFQLGRIAAEGIEARWRRHLDMQRRTLEWVEEMNLQGVGLGVLADEGHRSPTVTCLTLPSGVAGPRVVAAMAERGWVIGAGYGALEESTIRIGHMGDHSLDGLDRLLGALEGTLR